jgi:hypothetical protein
MSKMDIKDVCEADHGERKNNFMNQTCPADASYSDKVVYAKYAATLASEEMINEIHCMLLHLTKDARE